MKIFYFKGLKIEHAAPPSNSDRAIILCPGLPASYVNEKQIDMLIQKNFHVFLVLYPGYPNSSKTLFLSQNPADLISELIVSLRIKGMQGVYLNTFFLIGSSFGGSVVLNVKNADKIVALSPVIDYKNLYKGSLDHNYETFKNYLLKNGYKISRNGWSQLKKGEIFTFSDKSLREKALIIYNENDPEINPSFLKKFLCLKKIRSISIHSDKHLSFKNIPADILMVILEWLGESNIIYQYNNYITGDFNKTISKIVDNQSAIILTGSLASGNLVPESDIDFYIISERTNPKMIRKIRNHVVEGRAMTFRNFSHYARSNMRDMSKLFSSKIITDNQSLRKKIEKLRKHLVDKYMEIFLIFQILEKKRMEATHYAGINSSLAIKKGLGGRRSLGFMTVTYNALNDINNPSFWNSLGIMTCNEVISEADRKHIERFFNKLTQQNFSHQKAHELLKINKRVVDKYTNEYLFNKINGKYGFKFSKNMKNANINGYVKNMIDALYSSDPIKLVKIAHSYVKCKDAIEKYVIFYYLALNNNLPLDIGKFIALKFANQHSMNNVRRNLVESAATTIHIELLNLLARDRDPKTIYYAKIKLAKKDILSTKIIRYSH